MLSALDAGSSVILLLLGTLCRVRHNRSHILLSQLYNVYGITGDALDWFRSYLTGRIQRVVIEDAVSVDQELGFEVPQGSVLGPNIFACALNLLVTSFSGMECLLFLMQATHSYI